MAHRLHNELAVHQVSTNDGSTTILGNISTRCTTSLGFFTRDFSCCAWWPKVQRPSSRLQSERQHNLVDHQWKVRSFKSEVIKSERLANWASKSLKETKLSISFSRKCNEWRHCTCHVRKTGQFSLLKARQIALLPSGNFLKRRYFYRSSFWCDISHAWANRLRERRRGRRRRRGKKDDLNEWEALTKQLDN